MPDPLRIVDAIPLPPPGAPVIARTARQDAYPVIVCTAPETAYGHVCDRVAGRAVAILTDDTVMSLYGGGLLAALRDRGADPLVRVLPAGEPSKSVEEAVAAWHWLAASDIARRDVLIAFGGGVVADLGGWVASGYMRGIP